MKAESDFFIIIFFMATYMHSCWFLELPCFRCIEITCVIVYVINNRAKHATTKTNWINNL